MHIMNYPKNELEEYIDEKIKEIAPNMYDVAGANLAAKLIAHANGLENLAKLPSREILLATVCNAFNAPISAFARAIQAIVDKDGAPAEEAPAEA